MPDTLNQTVCDAHPVIRWLMTDGRRILGSNDFLEGFALCLREAGIDVTRITTGVPILHPLSIRKFSLSAVYGSSAKARRSASIAPIAASLQSSETARSRWPTTAALCAFDRRRPPTTLSSRSSKTCVVMASPTTLCCRCRSPISPTRHFRSQRRGSMDFPMARLRCSPQ